MSMYRPLTSSVSKNYGNKAVNLARLSQAGMNIPNGIVISHQAHMSSQQIQSAVKNLKPPLIVRSSTNLEDSDASSLAGVFKSAIAKEIDDLPNAIAEVRAWSHSDEVKKLLTRKGAKEARTSVIIQEYLEARSGGVLFTYPSRNEFEVEIGSSSTAITDGQDPDRTATLEIRGQLNDANETDIKLQELAQKVTNLFGDEPQDIEWLIDQGGQLVVLQARPQVVNEQDDHVERELARLEKDLDFNRRYSRDALPDIAQPTPITINLLERIYSSRGPYGQHLHAAGFKMPDHGRSYVTHIFGRPYFDVELVNTTFLKGSGQRLEVTDSGIEYKKSASDIALSIFHPITSAKIIRGAGRQPLQLKKILDKPLPPAPAQDQSLEKLMSYLLRTLSPDIFETSGQLQAILASLKKHVPDARDFEKITEDNSKPPWLNGSETWHLSEDENELSSPPLTTAPNMIKTDKNQAQKNEARADALNKIISTWDKTFVQNLLTSLDAIQQRRTNLHDLYVQTIRCMHVRLVRIDDSHKLDGTIWYASLHEVLNDKLPSAATLQERQASWSALQTQPIRPLSQAQTWRELVEPVTSSSSPDTPIVLAPGSFSGPVKTSLDPNSKEKYVLVTDALSQAIIFNHENIAGVITKNGGRLSHVAIMARELELPVIKVESFESNEIARFDQDRLSLS